jgi:hypothetical protein
VDTYFREINLLYPILHEPTFRRAVDNGFHLVDEGFARVLLVVSALASRSVDDPRVLLRDAPSHSAGWKWFEQANMTGRSMLIPPTLYDVQVYCVGDFCTRSSMYRQLPRNSCQFRSCRDPAHHLHVGLSSPWVFGSHWTLVPIVAWYMITDPTCTTNCGSVLFGEAPDFFFLV